MVPIEQIASKIYIIRRQKVMLDKDLADLYRVRSTRGVQFSKAVADRLAEEQYEVFNQQRLKDETRRDALADDTPSPALSRPCGK